MNVVNDVTDTRQSVITRVFIQFLWHDVIHRITATSYDKGIKEIKDVITAAIKYLGLGSDSVKYLY